MSTCISERARELSDFLELQRYVRRVSTQTPVVEWVDKWVTQMIETTSPLQRPLRLGLAGYAGSGKDTVGALLSMYGATPISFANALRMELWTALCRVTHGSQGRGGQVPEDQMANARAVIERKESPWSKPTSMEMRLLLQTLGSVRRAEDPDYWIKRLQQSWAKIPGGWVVTDVRYPNEARAIRAEGGMIWWIDRLGCGPLNDHESENQPLIANYTIKNDGLLSDLAHGVKVALNHCYGNAAPGR